MDQFDESREAFLGFSQYYHDSLHAGLLGLDMERRAAVKTFFKWVVIGFAIGLGGFLITRYMGYGEAGFFVGFIGVVFGLFMADKGMAKVRVKTKTHLVGGICNYVGLAFEAEVFTPLDLSRMRELKLLPGATRQKFEDQISGKAHGADFILHEAHLERKSRNNKNNNYVTVFRGILMTLDFPSDFSGTTLILRERFLQTKRKGKLKRVGLADPVFEKAFEAYGSDQVEARYLLTPTFMERLIDLETIFSGKNLRAAFDGGQLMIIIEAGNQFEVGSMFKTLMQRKRTDKLIEEIGLIFDIVDTVLKPAANRIDYKSKLPTKGT